MAQMRFRATAVIKRRPQVLHHGKPVSGAVYCDYILRGDLEDRLREFVESGVKVFHLTAPHGGDGTKADFFTSAFWTDDNKFPEEDPQRFEYTLERQARMILAMQPEALFYIKFLTSAPLGFTQKHPEHMATDEDGKRHRDPSLSSDLFLKGLGRYIRHLVRHCESRSWGDRIVGYLGIPFGEGCTQLCISGKMFDCSPVNDRAFRAWIKARYRSEARLRKAWRDPKITFAKARVPRDREWLARKAAGPATLGGKPIDVASLPANTPMGQVGLFHWIEPANAAREQDYCRFYREMFFRWVRTMMRAVKQECALLDRPRIAGLDITKQPLMGWQILSAFDGIGDGQSFPNILQLSGSWDVGELLDDADLDVIFTPADYHARTLGFAYEAEGVTDSMVLRDKVMIVENDQRCYVGAGIKDQGAFRNDVEVEAGLRRNAALTISRGLQSYWCNVGSSYFHAPGIHKTIRQLVPMLDRFDDHPHRETRDAIALIVDDTSPLYEDFTSGYQTLSVIWQRIRGLAHCGAPYRIYLLSDLEKENFPSYRTWLFPNLFKVDRPVRALLRRKVLRDGNVALFGPATGITDGRHLGAEASSKLLGVPMEIHPRTTVRHVIVQDAGHPIARELPASFIYGDSLPYGPTLVPQEGAVEKAGAVPLGHANVCWFLHRTGLFLKEFGRGAAGNGRRGPRGRGDYAALWSVAMPLPAELLRAAARYAGSHIWCEEDDVIYASDSMVALHSVKRGPRVLKLPRPCTVVDAVSGRRVGTNLSRLRLTITPPETRIFRLG